MNITTVGIDLAKNVFQVHGVDARGKVVLRRQLRREQVAPYFVKPAAVPDRHGGVCELASLGSYA
jgi:transposase